MGHRIGHCADGYHMYCGGVMTDRSDGSLVECECLCHQRSDDNGDEERD